MVSLDLTTLRVDKSVTAHGYTINYNDSKHKYWIVYPNGETHMVYGMTTVQKPIGSVSFDKKTGAVSSKTDTLTAWATRVNKEAMIKHLDAGKELTKLDVEDHSSTYQKVSDRAKNIGKSVHKLIEDYHIAVSSGKEYVWGNTPEEIMSKKVVSNDIITGTHTIAQELLVFAPSNPQDPPHEWRDWVAGQFDRLVLREGEIELQDHKTSSGVYDLNYFVQLMGYQTMLEWMMLDKNNTYCDILSVLFGKKIHSRRINLATKSRTVEGKVIEGYFTDKWVSTNTLDDKAMYEATLVVFNTAKKYRSLFWD